jgi:acetyl esterase/lipase
MNRKFYTLLVLSLIITAGGITVAQEKVVKIWSGLAPGTENRTNIEKLEKGSVTNVYQPDLTIFLPGKPDANHAAVIVLPGGGYRSVVMEKEGYSIAKWLNENGITAFVLKYRLDIDQALQDVQRAVSFVRAGYKDFGINPDKIGVIGFSAGGHLAANLSTHSEKDKIKDHVDSTGCKPNFMILVYGAVGKFVSDVNKETPPTFIVHAGNDSKVPVLDCVDFYKALKKNGVPAELHVYENGEHGFALREQKLPVKNWANSCIDWLAGQGMVTQNKN